MRSPMTPVNHHRIQRQVLEIQVGSDLESASVQQARLHECWQRTLPDLCAVFDASVGADRLVRIDRLEIDLGELGESGWEPRFRERLVSEVTRQLARYRDAAGAKSGESSGAADSRADERPAEAFLHFLEHGHLPW